MAGNSQRRGAVRKGASKKGATVGSGGQRRRGLEGKGPTPPAHLRPGHPAQRRAEAAARGTRRAGQPEPGDRPRGPASGGGTGQRGSGRLSAKTAERGEANRREPALKTLAESNDTASIELLSERIDRDADADLRLLDRAGRVGAIRRA